MAVEMKNITPGGGGGGGTPSILKGNTKMWVIGGLIAVGLGIITLMRSKSDGPMVGSASSELDGYADIPAGGGAGIDYGQQIADLKSQQTDAINTMRDSIVTYQDAATEKLDGFFAKQSEKLSSLETAYREEVAKIHDDNQTFFNDKPNPRPTNKTAISGGDANDDGYVGTKKAAKERKTGYTEYDRGEISKEEAVKKYGGNSDGGIGKPEWL